MIIHHIFTITTVFYTFFTIFCLVFAQFVDYLLSCTAHCDSIWRKLHDLLEKLSPQIVGKFHQDILLRIHFRVKYPAMSETKSQIHTALSRILKPLIRILLRFGFSYREFDVLAKQLFVEVCYRDFTLKNKKMTASRAAVLTGLDRKEIVRLQKNETALEALAPRPINRAARVIGGWLQDKAYLGEDGKPRKIPLKGERGSFDSLVRKYGGDITVAPILDELIRIKAVSLGENDSLELLAEGYMPLSDDIRLLEIMGDSASDLFNTIAYNLGHPKHPRFQRAVVYSQLSKHSVEEFKLVSHDRCQALLLDLNDWLAHKLDLDTRLEVTQAQSRVGIGIYYIEDDIDSQALSNPSTQEASATGNGDDDKNA